MAWTGAKSALSTTLDGIGAVFKFAWSKGIKPITDKLGVTDSIEAAWSKLGAWYSQYWDGLETTFAGFSEFVGGAGRGDMDSAADGLSKAWDGAKSTLSTVLGGIGSVFEATWDGSISGVVAKLQDTAGVQQAWADVKSALQTVLDWLGQKFDWL